jgi:hypothetical protein
VSDPGAIRVVLLAEGPGEDRGSRPTSLPAPAPLETLTEEELGPGHLLVRRALAKARNMPEQAILFVAPNRIDGGRLARGSDLHGPRRLRKLLAYAPNQKAPHLAVVLVDEDGQSKRRAALDDALDGTTRPPAVLALAVREFEAWLVADEGACGRCGVPPFPGKPESAEPGAAKAHLSSFDLTKRADLAREADLDTLREACRSFDRLLKDLTADR